MDYEVRMTGENPMLETRGEANDSVDRKRRYAQITEVLTESPYPLSAKEIAVEMWKKQYIPTSERNFTAPRLTELCDMGHVEPKGKKTCRYTGKKVTVYGLVMEVCDGRAPDVCQDNN